VEYTNNKDSLCRAGLPRSVAINVFCNPGAVSPKTSSIQEVQTCKYNITMEAAAACPVDTSSCGAFTGPSGSTYDLSSLTTTDGYQFKAGVGYTYYWNFCKNVTNTACNQSTVCQLLQDNASFSLGFLPATISEGAGNKQGVTVTYVNNQRKCNGGVVPTTHIQVACDPAATSPIVHSVTEASVCTYIISMSSSVTCQSSSGKELCCLYQTEASQKTLCTSDVICPTLSGYQQIGAWHVSNCTYCKTPAVSRLVI